MAEPVTAINAQNPSEASQEEVFNALLEQAVGKYGVMQLQMSMSQMSDVMNEAKQDDE
jgi:hypothetical protein